MRTQHLPGRAAAGQQGAISQALVCILGAAASHSSSAASSDALCIDQPPLRAASEQRAAAGDSRSGADEFEMQTGAAAAALRLSPSRFAQEHRAGGAGGARTPRGADVANAAGQLYGAAVNAQALESSADGVCNAGAQSLVSSPVSLADGMADARSEHDAEHVHAHGASLVPLEPDTCVLFRPAAPSAAAMEGSWVPGNHGPEAVGARIKSASLLHESEHRLESTAARQADVAQSAAQQPARLFSPAEAVRGFSRTLPRAQQEPEQAPASSASTVHGQRYSAVHGLMKQQGSQAYPAEIQDAAVKPELASMHQAPGDPGHWIHLSTRFLDTHTAAEWDQRPGQVSACR